MKIVIIGAVAAGTSAAAKARRNNEDIEIKIFEQGKDISYSVCGLPYFIGEDYIERENLVPRTPKWFKDRFNIDILTNHRVEGIERDKKIIKVLNLETGENFEESYDKLILATGSIPMELDMESDVSMGDFKLKTVEDAEAIKKYIDEKRCKKALILGGGYIGLELCENLVKKGLEVSIIEKNNQISSSLDSDMAFYVEKHLVQKGIEIKKNTSISKIEKNKAYLENNEIIEADLLINATGVKANAFLGKKAGLLLGMKDAYVVNHSMQTSDEDIYAVGDCALTFNRISQKEDYLPLGSTANKTGRICGDIVTGGSVTFQGVLGTGIYKVFDLEVGRTGLGEKEAKNLGYDIEIIHNIKPNQTIYFEGSKEMIIKGIADRKSGKLLGVQIIGEKGVDKRLDVFATAIYYGGAVEDLFHIDLAYAPPFSTSKDPVAYTGMVLDNGIKKKNLIMAPTELIENREEYIVIDVRSSSQYEKAHIEGAINISLKNIRKEASTLDKNKNYVVHCNKGVSGNAAQNILLNLGFDKVYNLSGGYKHFKNFEKKS